MPKIPRRRPRVKLELALEPAHGHNPPYRLVVTARNTDPVDRYVTKLRVVRAASRRALPALAADPYPPVRVPPHGARRFEWADRLIRQGAVQPGERVLAYGTLRDGRRIRIKRRVNLLPPQA